MNQGIELQTELGAIAQDILLKGEAIPEEVCARVLLDKVSSQEVSHHGKHNSWNFQIILYLLLVYTTQVNNAFRGLVNIHHYSPPLW